MSRLAGSAGLQRCCGNFFAEALERPKRPKPITAQPRRRRMGELRFRALLYTSVLELGDHAWRPHRIAAGRLSSLAEPAVVSLTARRHPPHIVLWGGGQVWVQVWGLRFKVFLMSSKHQKQKQKLLNKTHQIPKQIGFLSRAGPGLATIPSQAQPRGLCSLFCAGPNSLYSAAFSVEEPNITH